MKATITDLTDVDVVLTASIGGTQVTVVAEGGLDMDGLDTLMEMLEVVRSAVVEDEGEGETGLVADLIGDVRNIRALKPKPSGILDRHMQQTLRQVRELRARGETKTFVKSASVGPTDGDGGLRPVTEAKSDICVGEIFQGSDGEVREVLNLIESEAGDGPTVHQVRYEILACRLPYRVGERRLTSLEEFVRWMGMADEFSVHPSEPDYEWKPGGPGHAVVLGTGDEAAGDGVDPVGEGDYLRGHPIFLKHGKWFYADTKTPTADNPRDCGFCGLANTKEGHDGCLQTLPGVMNACCGHGVDREAYVQFDSGHRVSGAEALEFIKKGEADTDPVEQAEVEPPECVYCHEPVTGLDPDPTGNFYHSACAPPAAVCPVKAAPEPEAQDAGGTVSMGQDEAAEALRQAQGDREEKEVGLSPGSIRKGARYTDGERVREVMEISGRIKALQTVEWQGVYPDGSRRMGKVYTWTRGEFAAWAQKVFVPPGKPALRPAQDARDEKPEAAAPDVSKKAEKVNTSPERVKKPAKSEHEPKPAAPLREPDGEPAMTESAPAPYPPAETVLSVNQVHDGWGYVNKDGEKVTILTRRSGAVGTEVQVEDVDGETMWISLSRFVTDHRLVAGLFYPVTT